MPAKCADNPPMNAGAAVRVRRIPAKDVGAAVRAARTPRQNFAIPCGDSSWTVSPFHQARGLHRKGFANEGGRPERAPLHFADWFAGE